jgi:hypothetical protein
MANFTQSAVLKREIEAKLASRIPAVYPSSIAGAEAPGFWNSGD